jgi:hypothetical protein
MGGESGLSSRQAIRAADPNLRISGNIWLRDFLRQQERRLTWAGGPLYQLNSHNARIHSISASSSN